MGTAEQGGPTLSGNRRTGRPYTEWEPQNRAAGSTLSRSSRTGRPYTECEIAEKGGWLYTEWGMTEKGGPTLSGEQQRSAALH